MNDELLQKILNNNKQESNEDESTIDPFKNISPEELSMLAKVFLIYL